MCFHSLTIVRFLFFEIELVWFGWFLIQPETPRVPSQYRLAAFALPFEERQSEAEDMLEPWRCHGTGLFGLVLFSCFVCLLDDSDGGRELGANRRNEPVVGRRAKANSHKWPFKLQSDIVVHRLFCSSNVFQKFHCAFLLC